MKFRLSSSIFLTLASSAIAVTSMLLDDKRMKEEVDRVVTERLSNEKEES